MFSNVFFCFNRGRINHNRHFTFKSQNTTDTITFVPDKMSGSVASYKKPYVAVGRWLQICLSEDLREEIIKNVTELLSDGTRYVSVFLNSHANGMNE
jgi:hypothetical protein